MMEPCRAGPTQSGCPLSVREARHVSPLTRSPAPSERRQAQPPVVSLASSRTTHPVPSVSSSHPSGSATPLRGDCPADPGECRAPRPGTPPSGRAPSSSPSSSASALDQRQVTSQVAADREALEVPRDVLAELLAAALLPHVHDQQLGVPAHHRGHLTQAREARLDLARRGEGRREVAEEPRPAQAAASHDDAVGAGLLDHAERVGRLPDVAVAQHRDVDVLHEAGDRVPVRSAGVPLDRRTTVQRDGCEPGLLGDPPRVEVGEVVVVDPLRVFMVTGTP